MESTLVQRLHTDPGSSWETVTTQEDKGRADINYMSKGKTLQMPQKSRYSFKFNQC